jgi:hypothetical protein
MKHLRDLAISCRFATSKGKQVSKAAWWDLPQALENYLVALEIPAEQWALITNWKRVHIGAPRSDEYWPE